MDSNQYIWRSKALETDPTILNQATAVDEEDTTLQVMTNFDKDSMDLIVTPGHLQPKTNTDSNIKIVTPIGDSDKQDSGVGEIPSGNSSLPVVPEGVDFSKYIIPGAIAAIFLSFLLLKDAPAKKVSHSVS